MERKRKLKKTKKLRTAAPKHISSDSRFTQIRAHTQEENKNKPKNNGDRRVLFKKKKVAAEMFATFHK